MKTLPRILFRPGILLVFFACSLLLSFSFSLRFAREELDKIRRLQRSLLEMKALQNQLEQPAAGLMLISQTGVQSPLRDVADPTLGYVQILQEPAKDSLGLGLDRWKVVLGVEALDPETLGDLFASVETNSKGWWITEVTLQAQPDGLKGQVQVEALDKSRSDD